VLVGMPTSSLKRLLKVPSDEQPTSKPTSVTLGPVCSAYVLGLLRP
jgi:hypothetical protein